VAVLDRNTRQRPARHGRAVRHAAVWRAGALSTRKRRRRPARHRCEPGLFEGRIVAGRFISNPVQEQLDHVQHRDFDINLRILDALGPRAAFLSRIRQAHDRPGVGLFDFDRRARFEVPQSGEDASDSRQLPISEPIQNNIIANGRRGRAERTWLASVNTAHHDEPEPHIAQETPPIDGHQEATASTARTLGNRRHKWRSCPARSRLEGLKGA